MNLYVVIWQLSLHMFQSVLTEFQEDNIAESDYFGGGGAVQRSGIQLALQEAAYYSDRRRDGVLPQG